MARRASFRAKRFRNAQQAAVAADVIALMDALKIEKEVVAGISRGQARRAPWRSNTDTTIPTRCRPAELLIRFAMVIR